MSSTCVEGLEHVFTEGGIVDEGLTRHSVAANGQALRAAQAGPLGRAALARQELVGRGAKMSKLMVGGGLVRCEGKDPDGNSFSISDRA